MSSPVLNFRDLKASFESRSNPTTASAFRSVAGDRADMSLQQPSRRVPPSLTKTIDTVLETSPAPPSVRPPLAALRPSWIGPPPSERLQTPGVQVMKQSITIEYSSPGLQPPVYICTSMSDPQWNPIEMHCESSDRDGLRFCKSFEAEEGEYQYKFRLGAGDWWVCDESKPTVDDGQGNKNNLLEVKAPSLLAIATPPIDAAHTFMPLTDRQGTVKSLTVVPIPLPSPPPASPMVGESIQTSSYTSAAHKEVSQSTRDTTASQSLEIEANTAFDIDGEEEFEESHSPMLLKHERTDGMSGRDAELDSAHSDSSSDFGEDGDIEEQKIDAPLLRHETFAKPTSREGGPNGSPTNASAAHAKTLVRFPTHHAGIVDIIINTQQRLPADETYVDNSRDSPVRKELSELSTPLCPLTKLYEPKEEMLLKIREVEEDEFEREKENGEELDPLLSDSMNSAPEAEDADFEPKIQNPPKQINIEEQIFVEIIEERKSLMDSLLDNIGGRGNAVAMVVGLLVIAAGICTMQFL